MSLREWLNNNSAIVTVAALALLVVALVVMVRSFAGGGGATGAPQSRWYFDPVLDELVVVRDDGTAVPPITLPSGNEGWRANVFACGDCDDPEQRFVAWYERYTPWAKQAIEADPEGMTDEGMHARYAGMEVSVDGQNWYSMDSMQASQIQNRPMQVCPDPTQVRMCFP